MHSTEMAKQAALPRIKLKQHQQGAITDVDVHRAVYLRYGSLTDCSAHVYQIRDIAAMLNIKKIQVHQMINRYVQQGGCLTTPHRQDLAKPQYNLTPNSEVKQELIF